ncbi:MAG: DUF4337 domain-containing protein [bacterium]
MADDKKEPWLNWLALTTVILAVCATMATFKGGGYSTKSVMSQTKASDQWAFYQAKSIKGYLYDLQGDKLQLELKSIGVSVSPELQKDYTDRIASYKAKVQKYEGEKTEIEKKAHDLEEFRDLCGRHSAAFGMAVIFLQIAILLSSISALLKKKPLWLAGLAVGLAGVFHFINGFYLFLK